MLVFFFMVLGQLPPRKIAPPQPSKLTLTLTRSNFPWEQLSGYLSSRLQLQYKIYFHKGSIHILCNHSMGEGVASKIHRYDRYGEG